MNSALLISQILLLLVVGVSLPLFHKFPKAVAWAATLTVFASSVVGGLLLYNINQTGAFIYVFSSANALVGIELVVNSFSALLTFIMTSVSSLILLYSIESIRKDVATHQLARYYTLLLVLLFAMLIIIYTNDLFNTYVFMAIVAISATALVSIKQKKENFIASFRYLLLNEMASLSYLLGVAILYLLTGHLNMSMVHDSLQPLMSDYSLAVYAATGLIVIGLSIKAAVFPLHIWLPDAHSSAPSASSAMLSAIVIKAYLIVLIKFVYVVLGTELAKELSLDLYIIFVGVLGMMMGSFFALGQRDVKRILAYSSVSQVGYIMVGIGLMSPLGLLAALFHILSHAVMKSALFLSTGVFIYTKKRRKVHQFQGLGYLVPLSMLVFGIGSLGMIGIPLTSGFIAKFQLSISSASAGEGWIIFMVLISSFLNAVYYLPILLRAYIGEPESREHLGKIKLEQAPVTMLIPVAVLGLGIILMGIFPNQVLQVMEAAASIFFEVS